MTGKGIEAKLAVLRDNLARLGAIPQSSLAEFEADFRNVDSALHRLQTSVQALVDIGSYKLGRRGLRPPESSRDVLRTLEDDRAVPPGTTDRFAPLLAFRNRVVHLYDRIDTHRVFEILTRHRGDLAALLDLLLAIPD
ncbi:MAG: HepT-like ribonuclease domain-containing protein [Planctomycetota bacterium]